jgi:hypothetical protein
MGGRSHADSDVTRVVGSLSTSLDHDHAAAAAAAAAAPAAVTTAAARRQPHLDQDSAPGTASRLAARVRPFAPKRPTAVNDERPLTMRWEGRAVDAWRARARRKRVGEKAARGSAVRCSVG